MTGKMCFVHHFMHQCAHLPCLKQRVSKIDEEFIDFHEQQKVVAVPFHGVDAQLSP